MTARDDDTARRGHGWRKGTNKGVYELTDGTARIVKMGDVAQHRWWAWSINPPSNIQKFWTLREAKEYIEKLRDGRQQ